MKNVIENDILPEKLMGRLLPLNNTGHNKNLSSTEEWTLRRLINQCGFLNKNE
jgi:hypothetical protein